VESDSSFDFDEVFDDDYLYFYEPRLTAERSDSEAELAARLLGLEPGMSVLDVACGPGRIANRLAARGCAVTGLDRSARFLDLARTDAAERGVSVEYVEGDMRSLPWRDRFDGVLCWFTSWGYFEDEESRNALREMHAAIKPGARLLLDHVHRDNLLGRLAADVVTEREGDYMIDRHRIDLVTGMLHNERIVVRASRVRRFSFFVRLVSYTELRDWLLAAGFADVRPYGDDGTPLTLESRRMIAVATK
jgi:SAM-dependent methyltransferase